MKVFKGIGVSPGISFGKVTILRDIPFVIPEYRIKKEDVEGEIERFKKAIKETEKELKEVKRKVREKLGKKYSDIFSVHIEFLKDKLLTEKTINLIREERINCESALKRALWEFLLFFKKNPTKVLKDRSKDFVDIVNKIFKNLGKGKEKTADFKEEIIIAEDLSPSQTASFTKDTVFGFITEKGSATSHTAIMARALEIPAVVGVSNIIENVKEGDKVLIDGDEGIVIVNPTPSVINKYKEKRERILRYKKQFYILKKLPTKTKDGKEIKLHANIELPQEAITAEKYGAEGIGLYRTEYLYLNRNDLPSEEEQFQAYKKVAEIMGGKCVIIRTLDIGGDKFASTFNYPTELNPFLGWRAIRFCLERKDIFETQLKAIMRASIYGDLKIMIPMISTVEEVIETKKLLKKVKEKLKKEKKEFKENIELGIMIETPSAALISDKLAEEVDFFSIGTNDLIQYTIAVDRINNKIAHLYQPCHPSVLKLIKQVIENGHKKGIWVGLCGEMASIPEIALLLIGMGIDELSMSPISIPEVKKAIRKFSFKKLKKISEKIFEFSTHSDIINYLKENLKIE